MALDRPDAKMSKSHASPRSRVLITDSDDDVRLKIRRALTDSLPSPITYEPARRPGVANLLDIWAHMDAHGRPAAQLAREHAALGLADFKARVADAVVAGLRGIRGAYERLLAADGGRYLDAVAEDGAMRARRHADETMALVRERVGF